MEQAAGKAEICDEEKYGEKCVLHCFNSLCLLTGARVAVAPWCLVQTNAIAFCKEQRLPYRNAFAIALFTLVLLLRSRAVFARVTHKYLAVYIAVSMAMRNSPNGISDNIWRNSNGTVEQPGTG